MRLYLDVSCLNRPFDDQAQARIRLEAQAIAIIFDWIDAATVEHVSSEMAEIEIDAIRDGDRRERVRQLLPGAASILPLSEAIFVRAEALERLRFKPADAVHLAAAEAAGADVVLTCDDRMLATARRHRATLRARVENPLRWVEEQGKP